MCIVLRHHSSRPSFQGCMWLKDNPPRGRLPSCYHPGERHWRKKKNSYSRLHPLRTRPSPSCKTLSESSLRETAGEMWKWASWLDSSLRPAWFRDALFPVEWVQCWRSRGGGGHRRVSKMELHIQRRRYHGVQQHFLFLLPVGAQVESLMASGGVGLAGFRSWLRQWDDSSKHSGFFLM